MISVVIPVRNGARTLSLMLDAIKRQVVDDDLEVIVVDSGSTDGTQELARSYGAIVHEIPAGEFNHGDTRNLGARIATGEIIVFTVDDALPLGTNWIEELIRPVLDVDRVVAAYSRQLPHGSAPPHQRFYIEDRYGPDPRIQAAQGEAELNLRTLLFSNVSSAIQRETLDEFPFAADIVIAEDQEWSRRLLVAGRSIAYAPASVVLHSHEYGLRDALGRYFDLGAAAERTFIATGRSSRAIRSDGLAFVKREFRWLWRNRYRTAIPYAIAHEATRYGAFRLGVHHRLVPARLRPRISRTPVYWERGD